MAKYKIADVVFDVQLLFEYTKRLFAKYEYFGEEIAEFSMVVTKEDIAKEKALAPDFKDDYLENLVVLRRLCDHVLDCKDGLIFHSSAINVDGKAYLFTAPSGTGKSTHARLWRELLGDRAQMINDDKPIVRFEGGEFYVYGTPWNGKHNLGSNQKVKLKAICLISQAPKNSIRKTSPKEMINVVLNQTVRPLDIGKMEKLLLLTSKLLMSVETFALECNISKEAAELSFSTMSKEKEDEN